MREHKEGCPRLQFWDAGDYDAPCCCDEADDEKGGLETIDMIINRYLKGDPITSLALSFNLDMDALGEILVSAEKAGRL